MFVDEVKVYARAGHGGPGCISFLREAYRPKGGPDGGNGGHGGDVILEADHDLNNLIHQFFQPRLLARDGDHGKGKGMDGHAGKDLLIKVPCGTMVWRCPAVELPPEFTEGNASEGVSADADSDEDEDAEELDDDDDSAETSSKSKSGSSQGLLLSSSHHRPILPHAARKPKPAEVDLTAGNQGVVDAKGRELVADLTTHGERFILCKGGRGGLGNRNFATSTRQAPRFAQPGEAGGEGDYVFELRLIGDVGIVGYPNAGKSTLLAAISKARPKIAAYPFTTLTPQVGIVEYPDHRRLVVCDVPGLIEGAHRNVGLGHAFLRHIQRCKFIVILLDMAGSEGRTPWDDHRQLLEELGLYDPALLQRPRLVVANKMDEPEAEANLRRFKRRVPKTRVLPISAAFDDGLEPFRRAIREAVEEIERAPRA